MARVFYSWLLLDSSFCSGIELKCGILVFDDFENAIDKSHFWLNNQKIEMKITFIL